MQTTSLLHVSSCRPSEAEVVIPLSEDSFGFPKFTMDATDDAASSFPGGRNSPEQIFPADSIKVLPTTFVPGEWDVICQRGRQNYCHSKYYDMEVKWYQIENDAISHQTWICCFNTLILQSGPGDFDRVSTTTSTVMWLPKLRKISQWWLQPLLIFLGKTRSPLEADSLERWEMSSVASGLEKRE